MTRSPSNTGSRTPSGSGSDLDPEALEDAVAHALELRDAGREDWLAAACEGAPELAGRVRAAVLGAAKLPNLFIDASVQDRHLGRTLAGRFELQRRLGSGAMGVVYAARDLKLNRTVAVKVLRPGLMDATESSKRFVREAEAMASVQHASVITIHDRGETPDGEPYIVMEFIDGESLSAIVDEAQRAKSSHSFERAGWLQSAFQIDDRGDGNYVRTVSRWVADLAAGLEAVHGAGVLHRDIKPSNVLVRRTGQPVLLDFGIALLDGDSTLTRGVTSVGTPSYMPPEALVRGRQRTAASDVYSLAATLYHLLALRPPYEGNPTEVLAAIATRDPQPASKYAGGLPRDLQAILDKAMHRRPLSRYRSMAAFEADLRAFLDYKPVVARPVGTATRVGRRLWRSKVALGALVALGAVGLAGTAFAVQGARESKRGKEHFEVVKHLPPTFTILDLANREYRYEADRAALERLLDRAVATCSSPIPTVLLRASFRLDHGDSRGAAEDMRDLARHLNSPMAEALAEMYAAAPADAKGAPDLPAWELPEPSSGVDKYLLAYHILRGNAAGTEGRTWRTLLAEPDVRSIPHAEEIRIAGLHLEGVKGEARRAMAFGGFNGVVALEGRLGGPTAATCHLKGRMLINLGRFRDAHEVLERGKDLAPRAHTIRINAGLAAMGIEENELAVEHLEVGRDVRPNDKKVLSNLVWALISLRRFQEAGVVLDEAQDATTTGSDDPLTRLLAINVYVQEAVSLLREGNEAASNLALKSAQDLSAEFDDDDWEDSQPTRVVLESLASGRPQGAFTGLMLQLAEDPHQTWLLEEALSFMPASLDEAGTAATRQLLDVLSAPTEKRAQSPR